MKKNNSRLNPESREQAFVFQFEDDVRVLKSLALRDNECFRKHLAVMQAHINAYNSTKLQKKCADSEKKQKEVNDFVKGQSID